MDKNFNPRARAGRDPISYGISGGLSISIHAPVRGATFKIKEDKAG